MSGYHNIQLVVVRLEDAFAAPDGETLARTSLLDEREFLRIRSVL